MDYREDLNQLWQHGQDNDQSLVDSFSRNPTITISTQSKAAQSKSPCVPLYTHYRKIRKEHVKHKLQYESIDSDSEESVEEQQQQEEGRDGENQMNQRGKSNESTLSLDDTITRKRPRYKEGISKCFLCDWGNTYHDGIEAPKINKLTQIIKNNYGKHDNESIAEQLHLYFKEEIYDPSRGMVMLTAETALNHIEGLHNLDATIYIGESIKRLKRIDQLLEDRIFREDDTYDRNALADLHKNMTLCCRFYREKIGQLNFSNGNTKEDQKGASNYFNLLQPFVENNEKSHYNTQMKKTQDIKAIKL